MADESIPKELSHTSQHPGLVPNASGNDQQIEHHIPRPPNSWILYRQAKSKEMSKKSPGMTASELCMSSTETSIEYN